MYMQPEKMDNLKKANFEKLSLERLRRINSWLSDKWRSGEWGHDSHFMSLLCRLDAAIEDMEAEEYVDYVEELFWHEKLVPSPKL